MSKSRYSKSICIYQLKITLFETPIWRRIQVKSDIKLAKLHTIFQIVMGWQDYHLHMFTIDGKMFGMPDEEFEEDVIDDKTIRLSQVIVYEQQQFKYEYDFGDNWQHKIAVEKIIPTANPIITYPICLAGAMACPPGDCGGITGFAEFLEAIQDPENEEHERMLEWVGGVYDPLGFDINMVNRKLWNRVR